MCGAPSGAGLIEVGPQGRQDQAHEAPQDPVLIEVGDAVEAGAELGFEAAPAGPRDRPRRSGSKRASNSSASRRASSALLHQRLLHVGLAERNPDLQQILAVGAQDLDLAPVEPGAQHQLIEAVVLRLAAPDPQERVLEGLADLVEVELAGVDRLDPEIVQPEARAGRGDELVGLLLEHAQAHVLEHRQHVRQRDRPGRRAPA